MFCSSEKNPEVRCIPNADEEGEKHCRSGERKGEIDKEIRGWRPLLCSLTTRKKTLQRPAQSSCNISDFVNVSQNIKKMCSLWIVIQVCFELTEDTEVSLLLTRVRVYLKARVKTTPSGSSLHFRWINRELLTRLHCLFSLKQVESNGVF